MPSTQDHITRLLERYVSGQATISEMKEMTDLLAGYEADIAPVADMIEKLPITGRPQFSDPDQTWNNLVLRFPELVVSPASSVYVLLRWTAVAALLFFLLAGAWLLQHRQKPAKPVSAVIITPGKQGAVLVLADGKEILLDTLKDGLVALQGGAIARIQNGSLSYEATGSEVLFNTMRTPNGRQFHLTLPDGSGVWLNAASTIRYPTVFTGRDRKVEVTGEAYFEVAPKAGMPFKVSVGENEIIEVLGTSFNVNAYANEAFVRTTLLQGRIKVAKKVLQPGEQATLGAGGVTVNLADTDQVIAWKNGLFNFDGLRLEQVMHQLARWYDIEVVYENGVPDVPVGGKMTRGVNLQELLIILKKLGVHYRLDGRRLVVLP